MQKYYVNHGLIDWIRTKLHTRLRVGMLRIFLSTQPPPLKFFFMNHEFDEKKIVL